MMVGPLEARKRAAYEKMDRNPKKVCRSKAIPHAALVCMKHFLSNANIVVKHGVKKLPLRFRLIRAK
jgi:hypothetical protein